MSRDQQQRNEPVSTRRGKRKVDDVEKALPSSSRKRQTQKHPVSAVKQVKSTNFKKPLDTQRTKEVKSTRNTSKPKPNPNQTTTARCRGKPKAPSSSNSNTWDREDAEKVNMLLKNANVPAGLLSMVEDSIKQGNAESTTSGQSRKPRLDHAATRPSIALSTRRRSAERRLSLENLEDNDEEVDEDVPAGEYQQGQIEDDNNLGCTNHEEDINAPPEECEPGDDENISTMGESEDEKEVSINDELGIGDKSNMPYENENNEFENAGDETPSPAEPEHSTPRTLRDNGENNNIISGRQQRQVMVPVQTVPRRVEGVDESAMFNIIGTLEHHITSAVNSSLEEILKEIRSDRNNFKQLQDHVEGLTSIITTTASAMFIKHPSSHPRSREIQKKIFLLPALFNDRFLLNILPRVVTAFLATNFSTDSAFEDLELKAINFHAVLQFSIQPGDKKKEKFESEIGRIYSKYRCSLLMSSFVAMQKNTFNTFKLDITQSTEVDPVNHIEEESSTVCQALTARVQPFWLKPGFITSDHCKSAAHKQERGGLTGIDDDTPTDPNSSQTMADNQSSDIQESSQSSGKPKVSRSGPLTQAEISIEAGCMLYKIITGTLSRSRYASKMQLFHDILYVFTGWTNHTNVVDQSKMGIQWEKPVRKEINYTADLPQAKVIRAHDRCTSMGMEEDRLDMANVTNLDSLIGKYPEFSLLIEHDVVVNEKTRRLRYRISLIEVACRFLSAYITLESVAKGKYSLAADKRSFTSIIVLALGLRKLMEKAVYDLNDLHRVPWENNTKKKKAKRGAQSNRSIMTDNSQVSYYQFENVNGFSLDFLMPSPSKQKELLHQMILNLTPEEFTAKMRSSSRGGAAITTAGGAVVLNQEASMEEDESQGIFGF